MLTEPERLDFVERARAARLLTVRLGVPGPAVRGRLALFIEGAIERELEALHAPPPAVRGTGDREARVEDQLHRARHTGAPGIALAFWTLAEIVDASGAFDSADSETLRWWLNLMSERNVHLAFDAADRALGVYGDPTALQIVVRDTEPSPFTSALHEQTTTDTEAMALSEDLLAPLPAEEPQPTPMDAELTQSALILAEELDHDAGWLRETLMQLCTPVPDASSVSPSPIAEDDGIVDSELVMSTTDVLSPPPLEPFTVDAIAGIAEEDAGEPAGTAAVDSQQEDSATRAAILENWAPAALKLSFADEPDTPLEDSSAPSNVHNDATRDCGASSDAEQGATGFADLASEKALAGGAPREEERPSPPLPEPPMAPAPLDPELQARCLTWQHELESSHGPKPLAVVERQYVSAYVPLRDAVRRGVAPESARTALREWSESFARSYTEAFDALRLRGKRPTMVLDIPDLALRIARLHRARSTQLLLVDGMRFDLGRGVQERLRERVGGLAVCAERLLLWAALPATTPVQLELIGRGPMALRDFTGTVDEDLVVSRGRKASTIRRLRAGQRELLKLDIAAARLSEPGGPEVQRIDDVAEEIAERIALHFEGVPERTLVVVFGDHGFHLDPLDGGGTQAARHGGASPDEVLVPAFAWLVGAVH